MNGKIRLVFRIISLDIERGDSMMTHAFSAVFVRRLSGEGALYEQSWGLGGPNTCRKRT